MFHVAALERWDALPSHVPPAPITSYLTARDVARSRRVMVLLLDDRIGVDRRCNIYKTPHNASRLRR